MRLILLIFAGYIFTNSLSAQTLSGRITDTKGQTVPYATLYIRETNHGIMANEDGFFQTTIKKGDYTCEISCLGYDKKTMTISIPEEGTNIIIEISEKAYSLNEVVVYPGQEDPAYRIMRNVIARAPYHLNQVKSYESDIYLKGSFKVDKIPRLIRSQIKDNELKDMIGKLFVYESQSEVKYREPDKYELRVIALSSSIPGYMNIDDKAPLGILTNNIYRPSAFSGLLAPGSFSVYKFSLEDSYKEDGNVIHKIRIIPRKKNGQLVDGWLYIVDDTWTVQQANLSRSEFGATEAINLKYNEITPGAFLVTTFDMSIKISLMGIEGGGQFYASIKYNDLETNDSFVLAKADTTTIPETATTAEKTLTKKQQRDLQTIEELAGKDKLTTREAYKMAQLVQKTIESDEVKEQKRNLEIRNLDSMIVVTRDSLALNRDSSFWSTRRTVPLKTEELQSYVQRDNTKTSAGSHQNTGSHQNADSLKKSSDLMWIANLMFGNETKIGRKNKYFFKYEGLIPALTYYNFVDGFRIGQKIGAGINLSRYRSISISPAVYYVTARKTANVTIDGVLTYAVMRNGKLTASTGRTSSDFAGNNGTGRFGNTIGSLFLTKNTAKYYHMNYATLSNTIDIANGLILTTDLNYEKRSDLENNTSFSFFGKNPSSNKPHGYIDPIPAHESFTTGISLQYTPRHRYRLFNGRKFYVNSDFPTVGLAYRKGFSGNSKKNSSFDLIESSVTQNISLGIFSKLFYEINAGKFLSAKQTYLPDFKHFRTNETFLAFRSFNNSFRLENYLYATNDKWLQAHMTYASKYILLKQIPFMQSMIFDEAVHLHTLWTPEINYNEVGYSIGLGDMGRIGVSAGFNKLKHIFTGVTISLQLSNLSN